MSIQALQNYTFVSRYARYDARKRRRESWDETIKRVKGMHLRRYPTAAEEIEAVFELVRQKKVLGSQRALQFGGAPIEVNHARLYNCCASFCDRPRFFQEAFWLLLCGCGIGFSVQKHHVARLPRLRTDSGRRPHRTFVVADTIESWSDALGALLSSYFEDPVFPEYAGCKVLFDYRFPEAEESVPIGVDSGKPPEAALLHQALLAIGKLLEYCRERRQDRLRPIDAYDILMHASQAVRVGGIRRSASICVFSPDDQELLTAKTGNWFHENPQRARSNNSCLLLRDRTTRDQFLHVVRNAREFGEPGFIWADSTEYLVNPCCEIGMWPVDELSGASGWQFCNLTEINGAQVRTRDQLLQAARAAAYLGTWQAGYTDFPYLGPVSERITQREALLGVSMTGMMENPSILLDPCLQTEAAQVVKEANTEMARRIGIRPAARATCVKPAGTSSCLLGTSSGIHPHHARRYFRRVQASKAEAPLRFFASLNPEAVEESVWSAHKTDAAVTFCIETPAGALTKQDLYAVEFLEHVRTTHQHWVRPGASVERSTQPWLMHNVSNTVMVREDEWQEVADYLFDLRAEFTGVSLLAASGDKDYRQAPMCAVPTLAEIAAEYGHGWIQARGLVAEAQATFEGDLWSACEALQGSGQPDDLLHTSVPRQRWLNRAHDCARRHFGADRRKLSACLKDLANLDLWQRLTAGHQPVDYTAMEEESDATSFLMEPACAGGMCQV
jgi:ribonucleoside-diphosphate reductase alpha chain